MASSRSHLPRETRFACEATVSIRPPRATPSCSDRLAAALSALVQAGQLLEPSGSAVLLPDSPAALAALVAVHGAEFHNAQAVLERAIRSGMGGPLFVRRHRLGRELAANPVGLLRHDDAQSIACRRERGSTTAQPATDDDQIGDEFLRSWCSARGVAGAGNCCAAGLRAQQRWQRNRERNENSRLRDEGAARETMRIVHGERCNERQAVRYNE